SLVADTRHTRRARRGRPPKKGPPATPAGYPLLGAVGAPPHAEEGNGGAVVATPLGADRWRESGIFPGYHDEKHTTGSGVSWIKNPAAISPVWLEKPERIAALAMLTVLGLLVYSVIQRQVRLYLLTHGQQLPGNKGLTATPTATVVLALFAHVALVQVLIGRQEVQHVYGIQPYHLLVCHALGLDPSWYAVPSAQKNGRGG